MYIFDIICIMLIVSIIHFICFMTINFLLLFIFAVVPDDDQLPQHEQDNIPPRSCTPPTPPVEADQPSPPPLPPPVRARAMGYQ